MERGGGKGLCTDLLFDGAFPIWFVYCSYTSSRHRCKSLAYAIAADSGLAIEAWDQHRAFEGPHYRYSNYLTSHQRYWTRPLDRHTVAFGLSFASRLLFHGVDTIESPSSRRVVTMGAGRADTGSGICCSGDRRVPILRPQRYGMAERAYGRHLYKDPFVRLTASTRMQESC